MVIISDTNYEKIRTEASRMDGIGTTLESVLQNDVASQYLRDFLVTSLSSENYDFYASVTFYREKFNGTYDTETLLVLAESIRDRYVSVGAEDQINLSDTQRIMIETTIGLLEMKTESTGRVLDANDRAKLRTSFDEAVEYVLYTIKTDHFGKFQASKQFAEMRSQLQSSQDSQAAIYMDIVNPILHEPPGSSLMMDPATTSTSRSSSPEAQEQ
jgi:hypothetical protein